MYLRSFIKFCLLLLNSLAVAQSPQNQFTNLTPNKDINTTRFLLSNKTGCNTCKPKDSKNVQYLDNQTIAGYTFSKKHNNAMNMHPELGIGIGFKKYRFTTGITGTIRFIKTRQSYNYYYNKDTLATRYFSNPCFGFFFHYPFYTNNTKEIFWEIAPGFEVLYLERAGTSLNRSRANAISFHANTGLGYRITSENNHYYQVSSSINFNNFSYGKSTNIQAQSYFSIRFAFGFVSLDDWATKRNYK